MSKIILISCCKQKADRAAPARDLYQSQLFRAQLAWAEAQDPDAIFILSAKHHLLRLDDVTAPYDRCLNDFAPIELQTWARVVWNKLYAFTEEHHFDITFMAGQTYRQELVKLIDIRPRSSWNAPMEGLGIGEQLGWLKQRETTGEI